MSKKSSEREKRENRYRGWQGPFRDKKPPYKWRMYRRKTRDVIDCEKFEPYSLAFDMEVNRINQIHADKGTKPGTLGALIKLYRASHQFQEGLAPRTQSDYQKVFDYLKAIEGYPLSRFNPPLVAKIRDLAFKKHKFRFANYVRTGLYVLFDWGIEYGHTKENPVVGVKMIKRPKDLPSANRPWTDSEREAVLSSIPFHMRLPMVLMMFYALDPQDALALPKTAVTSDGIDTRRGKTGQPIYLPLMEPLSAALAETEKHNAITLCANSRGQPWTYNGFSTNWHREKTKLEKEGSIQPGLTLKGLRHTVATILREMGKDYGTIQLVLGHATEAMAKLYSRRADMRKQATATMTDFEAEVNKRKTNSVKL